MSSIPVFDISNPLGGLLDQAVAMGYVNEKRTTTKGAAAEFETNIEHAVSLEVDIDPTLDGVSEVKISHSGADTSDPDVTTISLSSTVYGGSVTVDEEGNVDLSETYAGVDLGSLTWVAHGGVAGRFNATLPKTALGSGNYNQKSGEICDITVVTLNQLFANNNGIAIQPMNGEYVFIYNSDYAEYTPDEVAAALNGIMLAYPIKTAIETDLDPIDPIKTLVGENNIWADTGDVEVGYYYQLYQPI